MVESDADSQEFTAAYLRWRPGLVQRLTLILRDADEAQDLVQQGFVKAAERWPPADEVDMGRWLTVVCVRLALDERRRRHRWGLFELHDSDAVWANETDPDLWKALAAIDRKSRVALVMSTLDGYSQEEIADALGVPRGTVASWLSRARSKLRGLLEDSVNER